MTSLRTTGWSLPVPRLRRGHWRLTPNVGNIMGTQLKLISTLYYVFGALAIPVSFAAPIMIVRAHKILGTQPTTFTFTFAAIALVVSLAMTSLIFYTGYAISKRTHWLLCVIASCFLCLSSPLGLVLGIFSLIILNNPNVKETFPNHGLESTGAPPAAGTPETHP